MNKIFHLILILFLTISCDKNKKQTVKLEDFNLSNPVHFQTALVDFYFEKDDLIDYCNSEDDGEDNDFTFAQILEYLNSYDTIPIFIPDTLGTKMTIEDSTYIKNSDSLIRVRDQNHPYAYITDDIRWAIIDFARNGKIKVFERSTEKWLDTIIIDEIETKWYGETNITLTNDSIIFRQLRWIK
ncbi:MAG: hypothetical protein WDZ45_14575 [Flavobacteriaceae bacterium]